MPNPITGSDRSAVGSSASFEPDACNPELASCSATTSPQEPSRSVINPPVYVTGESNSAASDLVRRHDASSSAGCGAERANAFISCTLAASNALSTALAAPTGIGLVLGLVPTLGNALQCGRDIALALDCGERAQTLALANAECTENGGVLLNGANSELICLVTR